MDYPNVSLVRSDWIPRQQDAGLDTWIESVAPRSLVGEELALALAETSLTVEMLAQYLADRHEAGALLDAKMIDGPAATGTTRYDAPSGLGADGNGVWFSTPSAGTEYVRWYVNGALVIRRQQDLTTDRSATLVELGATSGDTVQVCIEAGGVVGWWARVEV